MRYSTALAFALIALALFTGTGVTGAEVQQLAKADPVGPGSAAAVQILAATAALVVAVGDALAKVIRAARGPASSQVEIKP